ncbi:MAG: CBS domain-containing protein [Victivallales bacterium]|nr:CBS domain-containing protein [Victivallales bacterium]
MKMMKVLSEKVSRGHEPLPAISCRMTVREAAVFMSEKRIGATLAETPEVPGRFVGIVTERDIMKACAQNMDLDRTTVEQIMSREMIVAGTEDLVRPVIALMTRNHIRHIPLKDGEQIVALISIRDIMHAVDEEKNITINELSDYLGCNSRNQVY